MWKLEKDFEFEAAHRLPEHAGKCHRLHGHNWKGTVVVEGTELHKDGPMAGMVLDFGMMSQAVELMVSEYLDHRFLNDTLGLEHPTSERIAQWCYDFLHVRLPGLKAVIIEETATSRCEYRPLRLLVPDVQAG